MMRSFLADRIALLTALVGVILMVLTIVWHINPAEGSVVPDFLTGNPFGKAVFWILYVTCMPVWIAVIVICRDLPFPEDTNYLLATVLMLMVQGVIYFLFGKLVSLTIRAFSKDRC